MIVQRLQLAADQLVKIRIGISSPHVIFVIGPDLRLITCAAAVGLGFGLIRRAMRAAASRSRSARSSGRGGGVDRRRLGLGFIFAPLVGNALYAWEPRAPYVLGAAMMIRDGDLLR